jgi:hypothetical protein
MGDVMGFADHLDGMMESPKRAGAVQVDRVAGVIDDAAEQIGKQMPQAAEYVHAAAARLKSGADLLRERSASDMLSELERLTRKQPGAVFGAAVVAGFALSRFLKSSGEPRTGRST